MPLYMDVHTLPAGATEAAVSQAHEADLAHQDQFGVRWQRYWIDPERGKAFCLGEGPSVDAMRDCHQAAHGLLADEIYEVKEG